MGRYRRRAAPRKAIDILNGWSSRLKTIGGHDQMLLAGLTAYKFANAAEILRHTGAGWADADIGRFRAMLLEIDYPIIEGFKPQANGNWDAAMIVSMMSIAVFCDDHPKFDRAIDYYLHGAGKGSIEHYIFPTGQCQESTRDQAHTQLGLGLLAAACETSLNQGVDLYAAADNRLLIGFEYTAKYNLGMDVPCKGTISPKYRGRFRPIYETVYRRYVIERGLKMPYSEQVLSKTRPEGFSADHESWGTLLFFRPPPADATASGKSDASTRPVLTTAPSNR